MVPSVIPEWLPFARILTRELIHVPGSTVHQLVDCTLTPTGTGTVLTLAWEVYTRRNDLSEAKTAPRSPATRRGRPLHRSPSR